MANQGPMRMLTKLIAFVLLVLAGAIAASAMDRQEQQEGMFGVPAPNESMLGEREVEPLEPAVAGERNQP